MVVSNGYSIMQEVTKNRIVISLPQTLNSLTGTTDPLKGRRQTITAEEEAVLLNIVMAMYERRTDGEIC